MSTGLAIFAVLVGLPGALAAVHLGGLALAGVFLRGAPEEAEQGDRFLVVIPAHDEEEVIAATLESLNAALRPGDTVLVVADRCTDATAEIARGHGAVVLERDPGEPGGRARARQAGLEHALGMEGWDALVTLDADCVVEPDFLHVLDRRLGPSQLALQARLAGEPVRGLLARATEVAFALQGVVLQRGRQRLGLAVRMRGPGMVVRREVAARHRYRSEAGSEDLWFCFDLLLDGVTAAYVDDAVVRTGSPSSLGAATRQRIRWESGRLEQAREFVGPMLRRRAPANLEVAINLASPPLAVSVLLLLVALLLSAIAGVLPLVVVFAAALGLMAVAVLVTLVTMRARWRTWMALAMAPAYVLWKAAIQIFSIAGLRRRDRWDTPTARS